MILHLDADAFFASVEQAADPRLRRKALVVGGASRGVVASASYEARRHGITSAMPVGRARRLCPGLIVIPGDFEKYEHFSRMMFSYAYDFTPVIEVGSIDEGYADLGGSRKKSPREMAEAIRRAVRSTLRITLSEGVGTSKLVAQIASKLRKPDALVEVAAGGEREFLARLENQWLPGVGPQLSRTLRMAGLPLIGQIAATPPDRLALFAGKAARTLWDFANGRDERPVVPEAAAAKSYSEQQTFESDVTDEAFVLATLRSMADRLFAKARADGLAARTLAVRVRYNDFNESERSRSLQEPTDLETSVYGLIAALLRKAWERRVSLRLVSLKLGNLYKACLFGELDLLEPAKNPAILHRAAVAVDAIRQRYGTSSILRGHDLWLREQAGRPRATLREDPAECTREERPRAGLHSAGRSPHSHLNFRSCYSFMDSLLTPAQIVGMAAEAGCRAVGLCDPNLHGAVEFFEAARAAGIRAVLGAELRLEGARRCVHVQNRTGYANLCRLLSEPAISRGFWEAHRDGLITAENPGPEIRCRKPADNRALAILRSIRTLTLLDEPHPEKILSAPSFEDILGSGQTGAAADRIVGECDFAFDSGRLWFPHFHPPDACPPREFLARLAWRGLGERYGSGAGSHRGRLETELATIAEVGYEEYFLTVWDLLQDCRRAGIEWITRGSAADSMVCYCLGISDVCPVRFELYFQRFLNRERMALNKLPDIDIDFPHDRRDEVVGLLFRKHPAGHVAAVGGFHTFHARSAIAEIGKVLGMSEIQVRRLTRHLPFAGARHAESSARGAAADARGRFDDEPARTALRLAALLDGLPRHAKTHPCGIVLSGRPIHDFTPTFTSNKGLPTTHFNMDAAESVGLVKLDILAQGGLSVLRDARQMLAERGIPVRLDNRGPWADPAVWDMIATGRARGVHHIESPAMGNLAKMCACRDIDALVAIVSVIRPGAANTLRKSTFARRALGLEPATYPHPSLEPVLKSTHGVIAYEEHILQIAVAFAGMVPGQADILRRALVKMQDAKIAEMRVAFETCARAAGRGAAETGAVWELVHGFRGYAFCRAHSTAYALEAWQAAWLKTYHPAEFLAAVLTHGKGFYPPLVYSLECRLLGIGFLPPDVNASRAAYFPETATALRIPLRIIRDLPEKFREKIFHERAAGPFASLADFAERTRADEGGLHLLLRAGALDSLSPSRAGAMWLIRRIATRGPGMLAEEPSADLPLTEPTRLDRLRDENDLLGFTVSGHPLELQPDIAWDTYCPIKNLPSFVGKRVTLCGLVVAGRTHEQSDGQTMRFMTLADRTGLLETEMFAAAFRRFGIESFRHPILEATGTVVPFEGTAGFSLRIESLRRPRRHAAPPARIRSDPLATSGAMRQPSAMSVNDVGEQPRDGNLSR